MPKTGGSVFRHKSGLWAVQVSVPDPITGGRRRITRYAKTKREAEAIRAELLLALHQGAVLEPAKSSLADWLRVWLRQRAPSLKPKTLSDYEGVLKRHVLPYLGPVKLGELRPPHIRAWHTRLREAGVGERTLHLAHTILQAALEEAELQELIPSNPARKARPAAPKPQGPKRLWTPEEARLFLEAARHDPLYPLWYLALAAGLRRGELAALRWEDYEPPYLHVRRALVSVQGEAVISTPKTARGVRSIFLPPDVREVLEEHRRKQEALAASLGLEAPPWVFANPLGEPLHPDTLTHRFRALVRAAGLPKARLHDLRHLSASLRLRAGVPAELVSAELGHHSVAFTLQTYRTLLKGEQAQHARPLEDLLTPRPRPEA
ncbi:site-specific integrase [Thermus oshimai]